MTLGSWFLTSWILTSWLLAHDFLSPDFLAPGSRLPGSWFPGSWTESLLDHLDYQFLLENLAVIFKKSINFLTLRNVLKVGITIVCKLNWFERRGGATRTTEKP